MDRRSALQHMVVAAVAGTSFFQERVNLLTTQTMWNTTKFTRLTGITYPIVQGPFGGGLSSVELTTTVSQAGGLGSFGAQPFTAEEIVAICAQIRTRTDKPFNINLWVNSHQASLSPALEAFNKERYQQLVGLLNPYFQELGLEVPPQPTDLGPVFENQVEAVLAARPKVFSFVYGIPSQLILEECRRLGIVTVGAATTVEEALALENAGVDVVVATGFEAGGHRVSFLNSAEESLMGTFALVPQVADRVKIPVIAAGGIADARGVKAALQLGAHAAQLGTAFLATEQSNASKDHREKLFGPEASATTLTRVFTGRLARGLRNRLTEELKGKEQLLAPYPLQGKVMSFLKAYPATEQSPAAFKAYWSGQAASLLKHHDAKLLMESLIVGMA